MTNAVVHIVLPAGLALLDGRTLKKETDITVVGDLTPWYASVEEVQLVGGIYLNKVQDLAIVAKIWQASRQADALTAVVPAAPADLNASPTDPSYHRWFLFNYARNYWVSIKAAIDLIHNVFDLTGARGSKTLGNFSVTKMSFSRDESMPKKLSEMEKELKAHRIVIQSGGLVGVGGHALSGFAAKGMFDPADAPAGRLWLTTGMGANRKTVAGYGSAGKPVKYGSPTFVSWRVGRAFGNYVTVFPKVVYM